MSSVVGGNYKCNVHEYETADVNEWNAHCIDTGHTDSGDTACIDCGVGITFNNVPFMPIKAGGTKDVRFRCPTCFQTYQNENVQQAIETAQDKYQRQAQMGGAPQ